MHEISKYIKFIFVTINKIKDDVAVLKFDDGQSLNWPTNKLPGDATEGSRVKLLLSDKDEEQEREKIAKVILNEMLKVD